VCDGGVGGVCEGGVGTRLWPSITPQLAQCSCIVAFACPYPLWSQWVEWQQEEEEEKVSWPCTIPGRRFPVILQRSSISFSRPLFLCSLGLSLSLFLSLSLLLFSLPFLCSYFVSQHMFTIKRIKWFVKKLIFFLPSNIFICLK
jgi:hypothetical protein